MTKMKTDNKKKYHLFILLLFLATIFMGIGYASVNGVLLSIDGVASVLSQDVVHISGALYSSTNGADTNASRIIGYSATTLNSTITLGNNAASTITYAITIANDTTDDYVFTGTSYSAPEFYSNTNITYELSNDMPVGYNLLAGTQKTFYITFKYASSNTSNPVLDSYISFNFDKFYTITYQNINTSGQNYPSYILDSETTKTITFSGDVPYDVNITPAVSYTYNNGVLTLNNVKSDITINRYYSITYNLDGGTNPNDQPTKYLHGANVSIQNATKTGVVFGGWFDNASFTGNPITSTNGLTGNLTLYASWLSSRYLPVTQLVEGDTVIYPDANGTDRTCVVLYDSTSSYGIQIITTTTLKSVSLGNGTTNSGGVRYSATNGQTYYNTASSNYNNARSVLNTEARSYVNTSLSPANGARVVGTPPDDPDVANIEITNNSRSYLNNKGFTEMDTYYTTDLTQMNKSNINTASISSNYWMGSNYYYATNSMTTFYVRYVQANSTVITNSNTSSYSTSNRCFSYRSSNTNNNQSFGNSQGLRPVFTLKNNIYLDTDTTPYRLVATAS